MSGANTWRGANTWNISLNENAGGGGGGGAVNSITAGNTNITITGTASDPILSGTLTDLTGNVAGNNNYIAGMYAPPFGTSAIICAGTDTFLIEDTLFTPLLAVSNTAVLLGGAGTLAPVQVTAPTVANPATSDDQVATTAFVQSVVGATPDLSTVLIAGNTAGATDIDLNSQDLLSVNNISVASPYNFSVVSIFADATARNAGIPSPYAGQMAFLTGTNKLQYWNVNWNNVTPPTTPAVFVSGFTLTTQYEIIYVNSSNAVVTAPTLDGFTIVRFFPTTTTSGTITLSISTAVEYLVVGGGAGGGGGTFVSSNGGGGGAGGLLTATDSIVASTSYAVTVGGGGAGGAIASSGSAGANSSLAVASGTITAIGGGGGGGGGTGTAGIAGGSGGGGGGGNGVVGGAGTALQGNAGGTSTTSPAYPYSGGGGGAGAVGSSTVGQGGVGISSTISGSALFYAGGGGGGASAGTAIGANLPTGGNGGGGNGGYFTGANVAPTAGTNGRGGGGGGRGNLAGAVGAAGGSGVVIVRFPSYS